MQTLAGKVILVTGGTGSFGKKFCELVLREAAPRKLIVFSRDELKQHEMRVGGFDDPRLRFFIGDVRDIDRLRRAMRGVDLVVHAAAMKQVPACEYNPFEAIMTNVMGAKNIVDAALDCGVRQVIALSTDKAVAPVNLYGATKLCAEKVFVQANAYGGASGTRFSCVRYGNVVGSRGSVVPLFLEQRRTGKITLTDPRMTRFWLTIDQGVRFVLRCRDVMRGGEVFVPKVPSTGIMDLVAAIAPGCEVEHVGIRPGEKLHESLISVDEARSAIELDGMYVIQPTHPWWRLEPYEGARPLPEGFAYSSDSCAERLSVDELRALVAEEIP